MMKQFAELKVYELGGGVAFEEVGASVPFLVLPKGQATIKSWGASGFLFENVITGDVIAFVAEYDDVLDSAGATYGVSQMAVFTALGAFFFELGGSGDAIDVNYDNTASGLTATNVQAAIDEIVTTVTAQDLDNVLAVGNTAGTYDINLNNNDLLNVDKIDFNLATTDTAGVGQLVWNDTLGTLNLGLKGGNTTLNVGQQLITRVVNKTTPLVPLTKAGYQVVIVAGATGQRLSVKLAKADNDTNSAGTLGIVCENIAVNQEGFIVSEGPLTGINTTGSLQGETWNDGDLLYLSPTTFGAITNVKPSAPFHEVRVGYVEYAHINKGKIFVKIDNGYELDELHNVAINNATIANNDFLVYNSSTTVWENKKQPIEIQAACSDETTALTTGTAKVTFRLPVAFTLTGVRASLTTAQTSGSIFTVDINQNGTSVLGTKLTIDNTEKTSTTAATPATITTSALTDDAEITVDIDQIGDGTAKGLKITLIGTR